MPFWTTFEIIYLCKAESENSIELASHPGLHNHIHCTSSGKLLLAFNDPFLVDTFIGNGLQRFTSTTINPDESAEIEANFRKRLFCKPPRNYAVGLPPFQRQSVIIQARSLRRLTSSDQASDFPNKRLHFLLRSLSALGNSFQKKWAIGNDNSHKLASLIRIFIH